MSWVSNRMKIDEMKTCAEFNVQGDIWSVVRGQGNSTLHFTFADRDDGRVWNALQYQQTVICMEDAQCDEVRLFNGGYETVTTKRKMNYWLKERKIPMSVYQDKGEWWVSFPEDWEVLFSDMTYWASVGKYPVRFGEGMRLRRRREDR